MNLVVLLSLAAIFAEISLLAFGGALSVLPEMQRAVVEVEHWLSAGDFSALFALAQIAPGPNMMIVTLIGWRVAALPGAIVATVALIVPPAVLTVATISVWNRFRDAPWRNVVQGGLAAVTVGLIAAGAALIVVSADRDWKLAAITAVVAVLHLTTKLHPLWLLGGGALLGFVGLV